MWKKKRQVKGSEYFNPNEDYTFLSRGVEIEGRATLEGVVRIDGRFKGTIKTNDMLIIGEHAVIRGSITGNEIICSGRVEAKLSAKKSIHLLASAVVIGDITTPAFSIEDGAFFQGRCDMGLGCQVECLTKESQATTKVPAIIESCELVTAQ